MASIRKHPKSGRWQVRYYDPSGQQRSKVFRLKVDAVRFANGIEADVDRGQWIDPQAGKTTVAEWIKVWDAGRVNRRASTRARDDSYLRSLVLPTFEDRQLGSIRPDEIRAWVAELDAAGYAASTVAKAAQLLSAALEAAVHDALIPNNPAARVPLPRIERTEMRFLDAGEIDRLASVIDPRYRVLVLTAAYTGLRFGELAGLKVERLDPLRRRLHVVEAAVEVAGTVTVGPPKTKGSARTISLPAFLSDELAAHLAAYPSDEFVFTSPGGGVLRRTNFRRRYWLHAVEAADLEGVRFHDLRHSHVGLLISQGSHAKVIQARLGHASISTTLDRYGHLFPGLDEDAADLLDETKTRARVDTLWTPEPADVIPIKP